MKKSLEIIDDRIKDSNFAFMPHSHADWFRNKLEEMGFRYRDDQPPHFKMNAGDIGVTISPYPNVVIVDEKLRSFTNEIYCHPSIPQNEAEFDEFWNKIKSKI